MPRKVKLNGQVHQENWKIENRTFTCHKMHCFYSTFYYFLSTVITLPHRSRALRRCSRARCTSFLHWLKGFAAVIAAVAFVVAGAAFVIIVVILIVASVLVLFSLSLALARPLFVLVCAPHFSDYLHVLCFPVGECTLQPLTLDHTLPVHTHKVTGPARNEPRFKTERSPMTCTIVVVPSAPNNSGVTAPGKSAPC